MGKKQIGTYCVIGLIAAAVCLFLKNADWIASVFSLAFSAAAPLLVGCVIAYVLNILLKRIERFWFPGTKRRFLKAQAAGLHPVIIPGPGVYYGRSGVPGGSGAGFQYPAGDR